MSELTRKSVFAVVEETTENTPVVPSAATDYVPLHDGFSFSPSQTELENNELRSSIARAKNVIGREEPTASVDSYYKHSGVEGTAPQNSLYWKSLLGTQAAPSELSTNGTSTTSALKFSDSSAVVRGRAFLIQDGTNGYSIRNAESAHATDIPLNFNVGTAPASGTETGSPVLFVPADESHPSLALWQYRGNGGALELISGARCTSASVSFEAGEFISGSFDFDGLKYYFNPLTTSSSANSIDFTDDAGTYAVTLSNKTWSDPHDLASNLQTAMNAVASDTITVTYSDSTGKFTIASDGSVTFSLLWDSGVTGNPLGSVIGFSVAADDTGALTYTSDSAISWAAPHTPSFDTNNPIVAKSCEVLFGDADDTTCLSTSSMTLNVTNERSVQDDICAETGVSGSRFVGREVTVELSSILTRHDADKYKRFRAGDRVRFMANVGEKTGGNWDIGKCVNFYIPKATITSYEVVDNEGLVEISMTISAYFESGDNAEFFLNFI